MGSSMKYNDWNEFHVLWNIGLQASLTKNHEEMMLLWEKDDLTHGRGPIWPTPYFALALR